MSQAERVHPEGGEVEPGLRHLRARRLLRLPQDQGIRHRHPEARPDPHADRFEADGRTGSRTWIRNPRAVKPTTWMPRFFYNSNNSSPEDATRNEAEINAIVSYLFANSEPHDLRGEEPAARRREERRADRQDDRLSGLPRRRRRESIRDRAAANLRPAAREHRQQDDLRVDLQLGARSEALQPGDLHAQPAPDRRPGGGRRHLLVGPQGAGRRRGEGHAGSEGRPTTCCSTI